MILLTLFAAVPLLAQTPLRTVLLEQLRTTHDKQEWFVTANAAVAGLTAKQASWTDGSGNHSVGQLAAHLVFWNQHELDRFNGKPPSTAKVVNDETFNDFDSAKWNETVRQLDTVLKELEKAVESASDQKVEKEASRIAHVGAHNAYHIGQMIFVRKLQGSWDPTKGVK